MPETEVKEVQLDDASVSQEEYKKARQEGKSVLERPVEEPADEIKEELPEEQEIDEEEIPEEPKPVEDKPKDKPKVKGGFQKRIDTLTTRNKELEKTLERERSERAAERANKPSATEQPKSDGEPKESDYDHSKADWYEDYIVDKAAWKLEQKKAAKEKSDAEEKVKKQAIELTETAKSAIEERAKKDPKFDEWRKSALWDMQNEQEVEARKVFDSVIVSKKFADYAGWILHYYSENMDDFKAIKSMDPDDIMIELADLLKDVKETEKKLNAEAEEKHEKPKSKAPTPIRPVSGGSSKSSVPLSETETMAEYKKRRAAGERS